MDKIYLSSFIILITTSSIVVSEWPHTVDIQEGCQQDEDTTNCKVTYYCQAYFQVSEYYDYYYNQYQQFCNGKSHIDYPIHLKYKQYESIEDIPEFRSNMRNNIVELDLSNEGISNIPSITEMDNLILLNFSRNFLTEARLYNNRPLSLLQEIDYSNNHINVIEVREDLHYYSDLRILNMSHNQIANIPNNIFKLFKDMESLDISYNYITELNYLTFEGLSNLLQLSLSHNEIAGISLSLIRFNKLTELDLSFNKITSLTSNTFENMIELRSLNLSNNEIGNIQIGSLEHLVSLVSLDLSYNKLIDVYNDMFRTHVYLRSVDLSNNKIKSLPTRFFKGNNTVTEILLKNNNLEGPLKSETFKDLELVTDLDLSFQYYTVVEDLAFIGMKNLKNLNLKKNSIVTLGKLCFKTLNNLIMLDLSGNAISFIDFDKSDLSNLRELYFQNNNLTRLNADSFANLLMLEYLDISNNKISVLQPHAFVYLRNIKHIGMRGNPFERVLLEGTFDGLSSLPKLDISGASINSINNNSFHGMTELKELNISHCNISELQFEVFENTGAIEILDLSFNQLSKFDVNSTALINLNQLLLNNNVLKFISPALLKTLSKINKLDFSHNDIQILEKDIFVGLGDLRYLDVSFNTGLQIDVKTLEMCPLLEDLYLSSANTNITFTVLSKNITVSNLHFTHSKIKDLSTLSLGKLSRVEDLYLDHNTIENIRAGDFYDLSNLRMLDLSYNDISYIQPGAFKDNIKLYTLNVSHNNIVSVSYGIFRGLNYLSVIDFSYNNIESLESERFYEVIERDPDAVRHNLFSKG